ncbi:MAG TPA: metal-binding protein [Cellvibrio sp.]|mgnify:CR=1 FL=1|nr:metal-binding protein [Cellvibrio sp.]
MDEISRRISALYAQLNQESKNRFVEDLFTISKTQKQERCWCGSDKYFSDCHYEKQLRRKITEAEIRTNISHIMDDMEYCCASFDSQHCGTFIKGAHTIQRGRVLASMAKDGQIGTFYRNTHGFEDTKSIQTGIKRKASIFYGFCDYHDTELFKNIEISEFIASPENCWASSYRAICHEYYQKNSAKKAVQWQKGNCDSGYAVYEQLMLQENLALLERDINKGFDDISRIKSEFEGLKISNQFNQFTSYIIQLDSALDIAVCGTMSPYYDINAQKMQNLGNPNISFEHFFISTVTLQGQAAYVISYLNHDTIIGKYLDDVFSRDHQFIIDWLSKSIFAYSENTFFRLDWWFGIDTKTQQAIYDLAMDENYTRPFAVDDLVSKSLNGRIQNIIVL